MGLASCSFTASDGANASQPADGGARDGRGGDEASVDAATVDAVAPPTPFDVTMCPVDYQSVGNVTTSRYRAGATGIAISWGAAAQLCEADSPDLQPITHLVVFESLDEYDAVVPTLQAEHAYNSTWTGTFRYFDRGVFRIRTVTGQTAGVLDIFKYDGGARQNTSESTRATFLLGTDHRYSNNPLDFRYNFICECDGRAGGKRPR
ncbi:MAG: C-type lectin domain-containing protein [Kofleriaceae bacterium]|nr:C-type lectin domain-containing protein [Kofleriaceae bacterium]